MKTTTKPRRLRSECGRFFAERVPGDNPWYNLFDRDGKLLGQSTWWHNESTNSRIDFKTGFGEIKARFSYPRYPTWFRRRWVFIDIWIDELAVLARSFGCEVLVGYKPDINCYCHLGVRATAEQITKLDDELTRRGIEWNGPPCKPGQWDIDCPSSARWPEKKPKKEVILGS